MSQEWDQALAPLREAFGGKADETDPIEPFDHLDAN